MSAVVDLLMSRSAWAHPTSRSHRQKWLRAARYLRARGLWVLDAKISKKNAA